MHGVRPSIFATSSASMRKSFQRRCLRRRGCFDPKSEALTRPFTPGTASLEIRRSGPLPDRTAGPLPDRTALNRVLKRLGKLGFSTARTKPSQDSMIADYYEALGSNSFAQRTGLNEHCCGKLQPTTPGEKTTVILGLEAIMNRVTMLTLAWFRAMFRLVTPATDLAAPRNVSAMHPINQRDTHVSG